MTSAEDSITRWFAEQSRLDPHRFPIGIGDDMAQIRLSPDASVLITTDMLLDGTHFDLTGCTLAQAAGKAMAVSLSDCAAMATAPLAAVVAVALPQGWGPEELKEIHAGIRAAGDPFNCPLIGGDITVWRTDRPFAITVTMLSRPGSHPPVRRSTARPGDIVCVTGSLGGAYPRRQSCAPGKGRATKDDGRRPMDDPTRHLTFTPRVKEALAITELVPLNAMIDLSDGLSSDLTRICEQSKVGAVIESGKLPLSDEARQSPDPIGSALNDGEDFELLFTLTADNYEKLAAAWTHPTLITSIGRVTADPAIRLQSPNGVTTPMTPSGYDHLCRG
ncbi:MAG TPA: thiamine-phosphate kinase [Phycisphaerales bacterium]|nr:thiamine-phosphate kinase [Phycisphaerales bacterium]